MKYIKPIFSGVVVDFTETPYVIDGGNIVVDFDYDPLIPEIQIPVVPSAVSILCVQNSPWSLPETEIVSTTTMQLPTNYIVCDECSLNIDLTCNLLNGFIVPETEILLLIADCYSVTIPEIVINIYSNSMSVDEDIVETTLQLKVSMSLQIVYEEYNNVIYRLGL